MPYLRKPLQGFFPSLLVPAYQTVSVDLTTTLAAPGENEFWEIGLVTAKVGIPLTTLQNTAFIAAASLKSPPSADIRVAMRSAGFYYLEESIATNYSRDGAYGLIANLSSPVVVRPGEELELVLNFSSFDSAIGAADAPTLLIGGTFNALLSGTIQTGED